MSDPRDVEAARKWWARWLQQGRPGNHRAVPATLVALPTTAREQEREACEEVLRGLIAPKPQGAEAVGGAWARFQRNDLLREAIRRIRERGEGSK